MNSDDYTFSHLSLDMKGLALYHWTYDDKSVGCIVIDEQAEECIHAQVFPDKDSYKVFKRMQKQRSVNKNREFEKEKLSLQCGLATMHCAIQFSKKTTADGATARFYEFMKMLSSCGKDTNSLAEVLRLVTCTLSGYIARTAIAVSSYSAPFLKWRAPVLKAPYAPAAWFTLAKIANSLCIDTYDSDHARGKHLISHNAPVLPNNPCSTRIDDCVFTQFSCDKKHYYSEKLPAQYRDTAVLINAKVFTSKQLQDFMHRNPWCSIILYEGNAQDPILINSKNLSDCDLSWNAKSVCELTRQFVYWLASHKKLLKKNLRNLLTQSERLIERYNAQRGVPRVKPHDVFWTQLQLMALELFLQFSSDYGQVSKSLSARLQAQWLNLLLPGCCPLPKDERPLEQREQITETDYPDIFIEILRRMLAPENIDRFLSVPPQGLFDRNDPEDTTYSFWGYLRTYQNKKAHTTFPSLQFRTEDFLAIAAGFSPVSCDMHAMLKAVRKAAPSFLHPTPKAVMPVEKFDKMRYDAIILNLDQIDFLTTDILAQISKRLSDSQNPA